MKTILGILVISLVSTTAMAIPCHEQQDTKAWSVCGTVQKNQENEMVYRVLNPRKVFKDGSTSQIPFYASKNKICKQLLQSEGLATNATYVHGSVSTFGRALRDTAIPTIASIECVIIP